MPEPLQPGRTHVVDRDGRVFSVPIADVQSGSAAAAGYFPATAEDIAEYDARQQYEDPLAQARTAAEGLARGITLGASDPVLTALGADPEGLSERKERNPFAAIGGELAGAGAAAFATAGLGAAGTAGRAGLLARGLAASPAGLATRAGMAIEAGLGARATGAAGHIGATALGAAAEGAIAGVGSAVSEAELREDVDLTAELLLSHVGIGAVLGGTTGGALKGLQLGGEAVVDTATGALRRALSGAKDALETAGDTRPASVLDGAVGPADDGLPGLPPIDEPDGKTVLGRLRDDADAAAHIDDLHQDATAAIEHKGSQLLREIDEFDNVVNQSLKPRTVRKLMNQSAPATFDATTDEAFRLTSGLRAEIDDLLAHPAELTPPELGAVRKLGKQLDDFGSRAEQPDQADVMLALDATKRELGKVAKRFHGRAGAVSGDDVLYSVGDRLRRQYEDFRLSLEDATIWGEGAAGMQQRVNRAWVRDFDSAKLFHGAFVSEAIGKGANPWDEAMRIDARKIGPMLGQLGRAETAYTERVFREGLEGRIQRAEVFAREYGGTPELIERAAKLRALKAEIIGHLDEAKKSALGARRFAGHMDQSGLFGGTAGAVGGFLLGGPLGAVGGAAAGAALGRTALSAVQAATKLTRLQQAADASLVRVQAGVKRFFERAARAERIARGVATRESSAALARAKRESTAEEYDRRSAPVLAWAASPGTAAERIASMTRDFDGVAPEVAASMAAGATRAFQFLADRLPRQRPSSDLLRPDLDSTSRTSDRERARWLRYARAVELGPEGIMRAFERGELTREQGEVLRELFPKLHARVVQIVAEHATDRKDPLPYRELQELSLLLGVPLHASMKPESIARMQNAYAQSGEALVEPPRSSGKPTNLAGQEASRAQQISQRGSQ